MEFPPEPVLQTAGWRDRMALADLVHFDGWEETPDSAEWEEFRNAISGTGEYKESGQE